MFLTIGDGSLQREISGIAMPRLAGRARRASDADREAALEVIRRAYAAGAIDIEELRSRAAVALLSWSTDELADLTGDLRDGDAAVTPARSGPCHRYLALYVSWLRDRNEGEEGPGATGRRGDHLA